MKERERNINEVIDQILNLVPEDKKASLERIKRSVLYSAPELIPLKWLELQYVINEMIPYPPCVNWHYKVVAIFTNKPLKKLEKNLNNI